MSLVVHSARAAAHDYLEGEGTHAELRQALREGKIEELVTPLLRPTYHDLTELPPWLKAHRVRRWIVELPVVEGRYETSFERLYPRLGMAVPHALLALRRAEQLGLETGLRGIPLCALGPFVDRSIEAAPRSYADPCRACASRSACSGIASRYLERFGSTELRASS